MRNQILDILLDQTKFDLPQDFVNYHTEQRVYKHQLDLLKGHAFRRNSEANGKH